MKRVLVPMSIFIFSSLSLMYAFEPALAQGNCKYGVTLTNTTNVFSFHTTSSPNRVSSCSLPTDMTLCSSEPIQSTNDGYEVKLVPVHNQALLEYSMNSRNDCILLSAIRWKELKSTISGAGLKVIGPVRRPPPVSEIPRPLPGGDNSFLKRIYNEATRWPKRMYREGVPAQCANFVREVLARTCSDRFQGDGGDAIQSFSPWDINVIGSESLAPSYANSLAGPEIGKKISRMEDARPGDLVFLRNTYGSWPYGTITHIGIYAGQNMMIDRPTFDGPVLYRAVNLSLFVGALRINSALCR